MSETSVKHKVVDQNSQVGVGYNEVTEDGCVDLPLSCRRGELLGRRCVENSRREC